MIYRLFRIASVCILSFWWLFFLIWQPGFVDVVANFSYKYNPLTISDATADLARDRALVYATHGGNRSADIFFTQDEVSHLLDVYALYRPISITLNILAILSWVVLIVAIHQKKNMLPDLLWASRILLALLGFCSLSLVFFNTFFYSFHQVFFPQGNWQFAETSTLIQVFPETFWMGMVITIILFLAISSLLLWILGKKK